MSVTTIGHFGIITLSLFLIFSFENEISFTCKFSYERMSTKTPFEEETKGNLEMAY